MYMFIQSERLCKIIWRQYSRPVQMVFKQHELHRSAVAGKDLSGINVKPYLVQRDRARRVGDDDMVAVPLHFNALNARIWQRLTWNTSTQRVAFIQRGHAGWEESVSHQNIARTHINLRQCIRKKDFVSAHAHFSNSYIMPLILSLN